MLLEFLREELMRLQNLGVKVNYHFPCDIGVALVGIPSFPFTRTEIQSGTERSLFNTLSMRWRTEFRARFNIRVKMRTGKSLLSLLKTLSNNKKLAYDLVCTEREFEEGLDKSTVESSDETHSITINEDKRIVQTTNQE